MIIHAKPLSSNFTMVHNGILNNRNISLKAKGLLVYLLSRPPGWKTSMTGLCNFSTDGVDGVRSAFLELEELGHIKRESLIESKTPRPVYHVYDRVPRILDNPNLVKSDSGKIQDLNKTNTEKQEEEKKREESNTEYISLKTHFDYCRNKYRKLGGVVKGYDSEFSVLFKACKNDIDSACSVILVLEVAINKEAEYRQKCAENDVFVPPWKHFSTWLNQKCWTQEFPEVKSTYQEEKIQTSSSVFDDLDDNPESEHDPAFPQPE